MIKMMMTGWCPWWWCWWCWLVLIDNDDDDHSGNHGDDNGDDSDKDSDFDDDDDNKSMPDKTLPGLTSSCCFEIKLVKLRKKICD